MICPLEPGGILGGGNQSEHSRSRRGADDETSRRVIESDGQKDQLVIGSRDHRRDASDYSALAGASGGKRVQRTDGSAQGQGQLPSGAVKDLRRCTAAVSTGVL